MRKADIINSKIFSLPDLIRRIAQWRILGKTVAFTNGIFDIMHRGHIASLSEAAREADYLVVGLNSDASTKRLKGPGRPVNDEQARSIVMASLLMVDAVILFEEDTPLELIKAVMPDVLVKGGDYTEEQIVGAREVKAGGGKVVINPIVQGYSTTGLIEKIDKL
jgi:D-beta-D-heptose 7-phosphate kinase/D-beta-D-heptose 1-phosphate adenosyltransferase